MNRKALRSILAEENLLASASVVDARAWKTYQAMVKKMAMALNHAGDRRFMKILRKLAKNPVSSLDSEELRLFKRDLPGAIKELEEKIGWDWPHEAPRMVPDAKISLKLLQDVQKAL